MKMLRCGLNVSNKLRKLEFAQICSVEFEKQNEVSIVSNRKQKYLKIIVVSN